MWFDEFKRILYLFVHYHEKQLKEKGKWLHQIQMSLTTHKNFKWEKSHWVPLKTFSNIWGKKRLKYIWVGYDFVAYIELSIIYCKRFDNLDIPLCVSSVTHVAYIEIHSQRLCCSPATRRHKGETKEKGDKNLLL